ncbi:MAG: YbjN domain-containing protein [Sandaracinaceae bacterium]
MTESLTTLKAIANHLTAKGGEVMIGMGRAAMRARIVDFPAHVNIQFRSSGVVRVSLALPVPVTDANREVLALALAQLNRQQLGGGFVIPRTTVVFLTQIPIEATGGIERHQLDRTLELAIDSCRSALPGLEKIGKTGLAAV